MRRDKNFAANIRIKVSQSKSKKNDGCPKKRDTSSTKRNDNCSQKYQYLSNSRYLEMLKMLGD